MFSNFILDTLSNLQANNYLWGAARDVSVFCCFNWPNFVLVALLQFRSFGSNYYFNLLTAFRVWGLHSVLSVVFHWLMQYAETTIERGWLLPCDHMPKFIIIGLFRSNTSHVKIIKGSANKQHRGMVTQVHLLTYFSFHSTLPRLFGLCRTNVEWGWYQRMTRRNNWVLCDGRPMLFCVVI